jgi:hypothetical protein
MQLKSLRRLHRVLTDGRVEVTGDRGLNSMLSFRKHAKLFRYAILPWKVSKLNISIKVVLSSSKTAAVVVSRVIQKNANEQHCIDSL